jgi:MT0933-like antitoxin protein
MSEFMDDAKNLAGEHSDVADKGVQEAGQMAEDKTGGKFDSQIQGAEQKAEGSIGGDQGNQGNQGGN